jgi:hypothetical protein
MLNLKAQMEYNLMSCSDFQPYQLEAIYENSNNSLLQAYNDNWDGSLPSSVNPNAPDDFFNGDDSQERNDALCTALSLFVYSYAVDWASKASFILGLIYTGADILDSLIPVGGKIVTQVVKDLNAPVQAQVDALQNQVALDTVICDWNDALLGVAINPTNWEAGISGIVYTAMSDEWYIQQLLSNDTTLLNNFLTFVSSLGMAYDFAQLGVFICPNCVTTWEQVFDFTVDDYDTFWVATDPTYPPVWIASTALEGGRDANGCRDGARFDFPARTITFIEAEFTYVNTASNTRDSGFTAGILPSTVVIDERDVRAGSGSHNYEWNGSEPNIDFVQLKFGSRQGASSYSRCTRLTIRGEGTNPF